MTKTIVIKRDGAPGAFDACRRLLAACSLGSGGAYMADLIAKADDELDRLEADAQALADVRTLDEWAAGQPIRTPSPSPYKTEVGDWFIWLSTGNYFDAPTPEGARAKVAEWVRKQAAPTTEGLK